jgi:LDH2 family malate/lactate/ureidoglycolate dehydrogenase
VPREQFETDVERLVTEIRGTPLAEGADRIVLPGEPEFELRERRLADGIPVSDELSERLARLATELGITAPHWADR